MDSRNNIARFGTPEWKSINETRHAFITRKYEVRCYPCDAGGYPHVIATEADYGKALKIAFEHDAGHDTNLAECCMWATGTVCSCGNVLV